MLYDYVHVEDYQEEPDDEEAHIEQGETKPNPNSPCIKSNHEITRP